MKIAVLGIDLGKNVCSVVGLDASGAVVLRRRVRRDTLIRIDGKNSPQVRLAEDNHLIQALATQCPDQTFRNSILPRRSRRDRPVADTHGPHSGGKDTPVGTVIVAHQISQR